MRAFLIATLTECSSCLTSPFGTIRMRSTNFIGEFTPFARKFGSLLPTRNSIVP
nr:MAG TPA: hypothetical protein [Caudoviricetes sp.]